ncbi:unnamed protein product [Brassicogethes aeneus]|uniref:Transposase n=1 Tax=Brassicogethes aeneus TaxID=1431903 RepID=A0A9P0BF30_BRAAE|nr:unnamed protein product [Brassicogethes aeneus]
MKKIAANVISNDTKLDIMLEFEENPHTSSGKAAPMFGVSHSSILRTLKENKMHPYKMIPTQELTEDDFDRRTYFCEEMMAMLDNNVIQLQQVLFSDESTFTLHGQVNRQNCRCSLR